MGGMTVTRVHHERGSHIEPPLDQAWTDLDKLRWFAAVVAHDTGVPVSVREAEFSIKRRGRQVPQYGFYSVTVGWVSRGPHTFESAWTYLIGVSDGVRAVKPEAANEV